MPPRILIAEDDELQASVLRAALVGRGYEAEIVSDGLQAVRRLRSGRYDLALLDYHLPEVDGLAAARLMHDYFDEADRPGLIAVTATAENLCEKEGIGGTSFDAVVSKRLGLPALLMTIDANLTSAAQRHANAVIARGREAVRNAAVTRRRRMLAPLAAVPALVMVAAFMAGLGWGVASLNHAEAALGASHAAVALTTDTTSLVGAVRDTESSQRTYLATRLQADRALFEADVQRVDQLLISQAALAADGSPGVAGAAQSVITPRLHTLSAEVQAWSAAPAAVPGSAAASLSLSAQEGRDAAGRLQDWAAGLVSTSEVAALTGIEAVRQNVQAVLAVLALGIVYGLWNATQAVRRRLHVPATGAPAGFMLRPAPPPRTAWASLPMLDAQPDWRSTP